MDKSLSPFYEAVYALTVIAVVGLVVAPFANNFTDFIGESSVESLGSIPEDDGEEMFADGIQLPDGIESGQEQETLPSLPEPETPEPEPEILDPEPEQEPPLLPTQDDEPQTALTTVFVDRNTTLKSNTLGLGFQLDGRDIREFVDSSTLRSQAQVANFKYVRFFHHRYAHYRVGSVYYELSHDTLVEPILSANEKRGKIKKKKIVFTCTFMILFAIVLAIFFKYRTLENTLKEKNNNLLYVFSKAGDVQGIISNIEDVAEQPLCSAVTVKFPGSR